ncbi:hypothetical protein K9N68_30745 [Kovacikia minuta CCNUW1]|uniref:hypothetical protein n=1 Tax=Kovacikia minuta TaxID=2931930 RepID=UPI001CCD41EC|nr:hypothetical protein [Kovacikia minuta]UBF25874.1 hypothetical protein K9N68_30745 [Kovacikia minuta CCNUW1]
MRDEGQKAGGRGQKVNARYGAVSTVQFTLIFVESAVEDEMKVEGKDQKNIFFLPSALCPLPSALGSWIK